MNENQVHYIVHNDQEIQHIVESIEQLYTVENGEAEALKLTLLDDFDSHLWSTDSLLVKKNGSLYQLFQNDKLTEEIKVNGQPKFWWDFPESALQTTLKSLVDIRAITETAQLSVKTQKIAIRDEDEKIITRAKFLYAEENQFKLLTLEPLRGYQKEFKRITKAISKHLANQRETLTLKDLFVLNGYATDTSTEVPPPEIDPQLESEVALRTMSKHMLDSARIHEEGIIFDIDTEFLHQYRVNLRKVRSLLNLMKKSLKEDSYSLYKQHLSEVAGKTNALRDLDVFLLSKEYYKAMLPESFDNGIELLFNKIAEERLKEKNKVALWLKTDEYQDQIQSVINEIDQQAEFSTNMAKMPVLNTAKTLTLKRFQKIRRLGEKIDDKTPDDDVHELRIECKKLRYLMEFFIPLFPTKKVKKLIKHLKVLQTILGDFNDYCVQKELLSDYDRRFGRNKSVTIAINGLIAVLHQKQIAERAKVQTAFAEFGSQQTVIEFNQLFGMAKN